MAGKLFSAAAIAIALSAGVALPPPTAARGAGQRDSVPAAQDAPPPKFRRVRRPVAGRYIVVFGDGFPARDVRAAAARLAGAHGARPSLIFQHALKGFSAALPG